VPVDVDLLERVDAYFDAVPRSASVAEEIGPFTLFVNRGPGWRYYARPTPGATTFDASDVQAVRERQRELGQPQAFEWVVDLHPAVGTAVEAAGLRTVLHPLMHLPTAGFTRPAAVEGVDVQLVPPDDEDLARITAVAEIGFGAPGTAVGPAGTEALAPAVDGLKADTLAFTRERIAQGLSTMAVARVGGVPVASGSHQPVGGITEITGVATLPAYRRRGLGAAVTAALVADALDRGVDTVILSADDEDVARVYGRVGFTRVGAVGAGEPARRS
jgi:ribosomal protein S18 acetylase RimI-like enzyme